MNDSEKRICETARAVLAAMIIRDANGETVEGRVDMAWEYAVILETKRRGCDE